MTITDKPNTAGGQGGSLSQEHGAGVGIMAEQMKQEAAGKAIPAGYQQTEVGVIPEDWTVVQLKQLFVLKNGYAFKGEFFSDKGPVVLTPGNFKLDGGLYFEKRNTKRYSAIYPNSYELEKDDLVVVMTDLTPECNLLGKPAFVEGDEVLLLNQRIGKVERLVNSWDKKFLFYTLLSPSYLSTIKNAATGSTVRHTSPNTIASAWVYEPPKQEQTAIANVLSDSDALIGSLEQLIAKKQAIKSATMQQLLTGRTRLPAFALRPDGTKKGYKPSELGDIPEDWEAVCFGDIARPSTARVNPKVNGGSDFCIELEHIESGTGDILGNTITNRNSSIKTIFCPSDVLFGKLRSYLRKFWFASCAGVCSTEIWVLKTDNKLAVSRYVYYIVQLDEFIDAASEAYGTHMPRADWGVVKEFPVLMPSIIEQTAIATILSDMDNELQALTQKLEKARALKQGMMQQLLTGKIRLPLAAGA